MRKILLPVSIILNVMTLIFAFITDFSTSVIFIFCASAVVVVYSVFMYNKKILRFLNISIAFLCILFLVFNLYIYSYGKADNVTYTEEAVIILGAGINGEKLSLILEERLKAALNYYSVNPDAVIVVSGGQGSGENITEALAMERYLVENGVPKEKIIKEEKATSTCENIRFSKILLEQYFNESYKTVIVTNDFHVFRSMMIAKKNGLDSSHIHAGIPKFSVPANYLRETLAIMFQVIFSCNKPLQK